MKSRKGRFTLALLLVLGLAATSVAFAATRGDGHHNGKNGAQQFTAHLTGYNETPASLNSPAHGDLTLTIGTNSLTWSLTYAGFVNQPFVAHVHVGQPGTSGGVAFFFCGGTKPACPSSASGPVTITGTTVAADIVGPTAQGFAVGDLTSIVKAIQAGATYANMHTNVYTGGEIRGQLVGGGHGDDQDEDD
jgi:hypothetical protein